MRIEEFKEIVRREFGRKLEHATPANVRKFLDEFYEGFIPEKREGRFDIYEASSSYEEIVKDFLMRVLESPSDEMIIMLWLLALELLFAVIEPLEMEKISRFFGNLAEEN